jgi:hypothetical protein
MSNLYFRSGPPRTTSIVLRGTCCSKLAYDDGRIRIMLSPLSEPADFAAYGKGNDD